MRKITVIGILLWGAVFGMGLVIGGATFADISHADNVDSNQTEESAVINSDYVTLAIDEEYTVDVHVDTPHLGVSLEDISPDSDSGTVGLSSNSLDNDTATAASAGLCAVGMDSEKSPTTVDVDGESNTANASLSLDSESDEVAHSESSPTQIVEECADIDD